MNFKFENRYFNFKKSKLNYQLKEPQYVQHIL